MIKISGNVAETSSILSEFPEDTIRTIIINTMASSKEIYNYSSLNELKFELTMRVNIVNASRDLYKSGIKFKTFKESMCNEDYWERTENGGFLLREGIKASEGINDIFKNGSKYGTECSTAVVIVYYKAILDTYSEELFNKTFEKIFLVGWHYVDNDLDILVYKSRVDYFPGDYRYFSNPEFDHKNSEWRGENVIDLGDDTYYGHGIGIKTSKDIIKALNKHRKKGAKESAFLMDITGYPNFKRLSAIYYQFLEGARI